MKKVSFILFGGTGDLTKKKISEAFVHLIKEKEIDKDSFLIGVSRKDLSDSEYKQFLVDSIRDKEDKKSLGKLNVKYAQGDFTKEGGLDKLKEVLSKNEKKGSDRIYYFSTSFKFFPAISKELHKLHLDKNPHGTIKVVFEKPFGKDLESFEELNKGIKKFFSEKQVFRVDHYLGKKTVQNLNVLKFSNPIINSSLKGKNIESIEIIVDEDLGVGNRIEYYNESGAINDMIQNHILQVLSLVLMKKPSKFNSEKISSEKIKILKSLKILPPENHLLGQYKSYKEEIKKSNLQDKNTETFAKIILESKSKRWKGVKLILRTGKKLEKKRGKSGLVLMGNRITKMLLVSRAV
jgi:glucose-6-phosphate 1-dehydrogenase